MLPAVPVVAPICTESAWVVNVCVLLVANGVVKAASPVAIKPSRTALLPVPFFWWIPMRYRVPTTSAVGVAAMLVVPLRKVSFPVVSRVSAPTDVPASVMRTTRTWPAGMAANRT